MKEVKAYLSIDGILFKNEKDCIDHEEKFNLNKKIHEFFIIHGWNGMNQDEIASVILGNMTEFSEIIKGGK